jgi:hypothetical protein
MVANIGVIIGPMLGGITSDPAGSYPNLFGGIAWLEKFPYSPPNLLSAIFLSFAALGVSFGLKEVSGSGRLTFEAQCADFLRPTIPSATKKTLV